MAGRDGGVPQAWLLKLSRAAMTCNDPLQLWEGSERHLERRNGRGEGEGKVVRWMVSFRPRDRSMSNPRLTSPGRIGKYPSSFFKPPYLPPCSLGLLLVQISSMADHVHEPATSGVVDWILNNRLKAIGYTCA